ncbi:TadA family conjugal transfer-associated ATPase [Corynebacterium epidermidicanis]|uniref:Helicase/secretion neighborhood ATPase n=1 Tax=Corynebacterium epidermidicanis TaxID=1050174 RepID=A0A0G3GTN3_9CORY|nr:TadA family conjugal transfer-associated ATPase [Corynebacterium epidermidicanis]AKK02172.1 helicase/secretion neighborhood ATPase [Corynebacterium epidermidicanis]
MLSQREIIERIQQQLASRTASEVTPTFVAQLVRQEAGVISDEAVLQVLRRIRNDSQGVGELEQILAVPGVTDVLVNGPDSVWFDRGQGVERARLTFDSEASVRQLATRLAVSCGRRLDDAQPFADGRLLRDDGSSIRVHAMLSPPAEGGTCISLRVLRQASTSLADLEKRASVPAEAAQLLRAAVRDRQSFLVVGGTGSGKTTLLSALLGEVSPEERIICIEDTAELKPQHPHVLSLVARTHNVEGAGAISMGDLLKQALRMRPDRIVLGEIRGAEVVDLLAALNTGHDGGAGTIHANSIHEVPARMEALARLGGLDRDALHAQLIAAVQLVVAMKRTPQGRFLAHIGRLVNTRARELAIESIWSHPDPALSAGGHDD